MRNELIFLYDSTVKQRRWDIGPDSQRLTNGRSVLWHLGRIVARLLGRGQKPTGPVVHR